ncbi:hypothetical protein [Winogradskyella marincola]|uniref:Uncharacterized protein n=1 Tax=Winogradskyella marincola TaxID=3037795 RepID=A0ABT6G1F0_9FLAO|nr:hypothetical protein [Winogradskyella sp. YYF002]MDG4715785.1 hypothetical protein [Winogradskyella sp. YYF002]
MSSYNKRISFYLILTFSLLFNISAQENDIKLFDEDTTIEKKVSTNDIDILNKYVYSNIASAYKLSSSNQTPISKDTKRLYVDLENLKTINSEKSNSIEVVIIKLLNENDLTQSIQLDFTTNFPNLKCVYISCEVKSSLLEMKKAIQKPKQSIKTYLGFNLPE